MAGLVLKVNFVNQTKFSAILKHLFSKAAITYRTQTPIDLKQKIPIARIGNQHPLADSADLNLKRALSTQKLFYISKQLVSRKKRRV